jgi:undecaprenyl diphosphate synthase
MIKHIALIPDGNRRWAKKKGLFPWQGHFEGAKNLERILKKVWEMKIPYFTFWGTSADNLAKRPKEEVGTLFLIFRRYFKKLLFSKEVVKEKIKINIFGKWQKYFPQDLQNLLKRVIEKTKRNGDYVLTFLLAYNGTEEMLEAIQKIVKTAKNKVDEKLILENLWTGSLPPVDLVIRTGCQGDPHNSAGFMMWHTAYSQYYFTKTLFPDFTPEEFEKTIKGYLKRERRLGK